VSNKTLRLINFFAAIVS